MIKKYLLPFIGSIMLTAGCVHNKAVDTAVPTAPTGTFAGKFERFHFNTTRNAYDTVTTNVTVMLAGAPGYNFKVTGDTSFLAGSHGNFAYNGSYIQFNDSTYTPAIAATGLKAKPHLAGVFQYAYDGTTFLLQQAYSSDTLVYEYNLKKQ